MNKSFVSVFCSMFFLVSCSRFVSVKSDPAPYLASLPEHTGGRLVGFTQKDFSDCDNGFYVYLPDGWDSSGIHYPTIVWYCGHNGIGDSREDPKELAKMLLNGIPKLIKEDRWKPLAPFIVIIPQARWRDPVKRDSYIYSSDNIKFWTSLYQQFPIDQQRMYLTGHSDGGGVVYWIVGHGGDRAFFAAAVPVSGNAFDFIIPKDRSKIIRGMSRTPLWLFHGKGDNFVPLYMSVDVIKEMRVLRDRPYEAKLTVFSELGHFCNDEIFLPDMTVKTEAQWDPYDQDIYSWMLQYKRVRSDGF